MSLETRLSALITAIGADIKALQAASGGSSDPFWTGHRKKMELFEDFMGGGTPQLVLFNSGTGTSATVLTSSPPDDNCAGVVTLNTGTDSVGKAAVRSQADQLSLGKGKAYFSAKVYMSALDDASNRFGARVGFGDSDWGDMVDGVYFEAISTTSGFWRCVTSASSTRTAVVTTVALAAATWYHLGIEINADGTEAKFYIDGVLVATMTTNIPTASYQRTGFGAWIVKTVGYDARLLYVDYVGAKIERTTMR